MNDTKKKSGWRSTMINGCFLASGLMIGTKVAQNANRPEPSESAQMAEDDSTQVAVPPIDGDASPDDQVADRESDRQQDSDRNSKNGKRKINAVAVSHEESASRSSSSSDDTSDARVEDLESPEDRMGRSLTKDEMVVRKRPIGAGADKPGEDKSANQVPFPNANANVVARKVPNANQPRFRLEKIPAGAAEVVQVQPVQEGVDAAKAAVSDAKTESDEKSKSDASQEEMKSAKEPETESAKATKTKRVKEPETELERLQRALKEMKASSSR